MSREDHWSVILAGLGLGVPLCVKRVSWSLFGEGTMNGEGRSRQKADRKGKQERNSSGPCMQAVPGTRSTFPTCYFSIPSVPHSKILPVIAWVLWCLAFTHHLWYLLKWPLKKNSPSSVSLCITEVPKELFHLSADSLLLSCFSCPTLLYSPAL